MSLRAGSTRVFILIIGILVGVGMYSLVESPLFRVEKIVVTGTERVSPEDVQNTCGIPLGTHFLKVRPQEATEALSSLPWVRTADIRVKVPGTLIVYVTERTPVGYIPIGGGFYSFDRDGVLLEVVNDMQDIDLPVLTGLDLDGWAGRLPEPGFRIADPRVIPAGDLLVSLLSSKETISEISVDVSGEHIIYMLDGMKVLFGQVGPDLDEKVGLLREILRDIQNAQVPTAYVDLRFKGKPIIKVRGS
jgi:cell division protein FtsQ